MQPGNVEIMKKNGKIFLLTAQPETILNRVKNNLCDPSMTGYFSGIIYNIDRMADNCVGIAEEACDNVTFISLDEEADKTAAEGGAV